VLPLLHLLPSHALLLLLDPAAERWLQHRRHPLNLLHLLL
jgi:hypothetical protein